MSINILPNFLFLRFLLRELLRETLRNSVVNWFYLESIVSNN